MTSRTYETIEYGIEDEDASSPISHPVLRMAGLVDDGPAWRWRLVGRLVDVGTCDPDVDYGVTIYSVARQLDIATPGRDHQANNDREVDLEGAKALHQDERRRLVAESLLLAHVPVPDVAVEIGISARCLHDYCELYFDVLDRLDAREWITCNVLEPTHESRSPAGSAILRAAQTGGEQVCRHWLSHLDHLGEQHDITTAIGRDRERIELTIELNRPAGQASPRFAAIQTMLLTEIDQQLPRTPAVAQLIAAQANRVLRASFDSASSIAGYVHETEQAAESDIRRSA